MAQKIDCKVHEIDLSDSSLSKNHKNTPVSLQEKIKSRTKFAFIKQTSLPFSCVYFELRDVVKDANPHCTKTPTWPKVTVKENFEHKCTDGETCPGITLEVEDDMKVRYTMKPVNK